MCRKAELAGPAAQTKDAGEHAPLPLDRSEPGMLDVPVADQMALGPPIAPTRDERHAATGRARRLGSPAAALPPGQRWKRRLPKACW
jgi:hypothetical protein